MKRMKKDTLSLILRAAVTLSAIMTAGVVILLVGYILIKGIPCLTPDLFAWKYTSENGSLMSSLINTVIMIILALIIAGPIGIFSAIYLVEYAKRGNKVVGVVRMTAEMLSGIPSIVYGLFGYLFFVKALGWSYSIMAGAFTLAIMVLPLIMRTTEEALKAVPDSYREGSFGLGAGRLRTVFRIILPSAVPGILAGIILAIGRIVGETAALIYTAGTVAEVPVWKWTGHPLRDLIAPLFSSGSTLSVHMYRMSSEGLHINTAYGTAVVLLVIVIVINALSSFVAKKLSKADGGQ
ncbi:MAG: phosphate ABC transporter permease PstA [Firmicutes bacterium]|nr:phosphate ABC transporter permease PstA [Bacillota bacterium]